jgi:hypothetical protein
VRVQRAPGPGVLRQRISRALTPSGHRALFWAGRVYALRKRGLRRTGLEAAFGLFFRMVCVRFGSAALITGAGAGLGGCSTGVGHLSGACRLTGLSRTAVGRRPA